MPIFEFYSPDTHKIYSFFAKTLAQAKVTPPCPDDPRARMVKMFSGFAIRGGKRKAEKEGRETEPGGDPVEDTKMEAALSALEREFSSADENDPKAMARMMRRMAELSGEKLDEPMEEAVRKLEEGADPDALEGQLGDTFGAEGDLSGDGPLPGTGKESDKKEPRARFKARCLPPARDPKLYDYE